MEQLSTVVDYVVGEGAILRHFPRAFEFTQEDVAEIDAICEEEDYIKFKLYGKECVQHRKQKMFGQDYKFSGITVKAHDGDTPALVLKAQQFATQQFPEMDTNAVLAIKYGPDDYISKHRDNEGKHHKGKPIVGFNFGETRTLTIRSYKRKRGDEGYQKMELELEHGSCYAMMGDKFQTNYTHEVGKGKGIRVSLTVRHFV
jgi:alkylated DNA repair dioxygenase AlkB